MPKTLVHHILPQDIQKSPETVLQKKLQTCGLCWLLKLRQMETQGVHMKGVFPWLVRLGSLCRYKSFLDCVGCFSWPSTKYFVSSPYTITSFVPIALQAGQLVVPRCLSLNECLWSVHIISCCCGQGGAAGADGAPVLSLHIISCCCGQGGAAGAAGAPDHGLYI